MNSIIEIILSFPLYDRLRRRSDCKFEKGRLLFRVLRVILVASLVILGFEVVATSLHYSPRTWELFHVVYVGWLTFRADYIAPFIHTLSKFCVVLFLIQSVDRMVLCFGCFWIRYKRIQPKLKGDDAFGIDDIEEGSTASYPMVLVQIPMCNEREVKH